jgi:outer membrane lipoprotein-sorting protein
VKKSILLGLLAFLLIGALSFSVFAAAVPEFSADFSLTDAKGKVATGKIFMEGEKIRQETVAKGESSVLILRLDKKVSWTLMPNNKYMEIKIPFDPAHPTQDFQYDKADIGSETVNGYSCKVVQYTYKETKYGTMTQWVADKLGFAIKIQTKDDKGKLTMTVDYTNIQVGKQPDSLFEVPAGYEKFSLPGGIKLPGM